MQALKSAFSQKRKGHAARIDEVTARPTSKQIDAICQREGQDHDKKCPQVDK
jgi:hypothetical protein